MAKKKLKQQPVRVDKKSITYECPTRGTVTQEVEVKVYACPCDEFSVSDLINLDNIIEADTDK